MDNKLAVIDLGSNTFHLLITDENLTPIDRNRSFVSLAEHGIEHIGDASIERGIACLRAFKTTLDHYNITDYIVFGTSALRSADNADRVIKIFADTIDSKIYIINGEREAELIAKGVQLLLNDDHKKGNHLLIDIGGGSTEFNLISDGVIIYSASYDLGIGVMHNLFHTEDPISHVSIKKLYAHLEKVTAPLIEKLEKLHLDSIIGSSGTFETFAKIQHLDLYENKLYKIDKAGAMRYMKRMIKLDYKHRAEAEHISETRAKFIVEGYLLALFYIENFQPSKIYLSPYAIKEGVLSEIIEARQ